MIGDLSVLDKKNIDILFRRFLFPFLYLIEFCNDSYVRCACLSPISLTMLKCVLNFERQMNKLFIQKRNIQKSRNNAWYGLLTKA